MRTTKQLLSMLAVGAFVVGALAQHAHGNACYSIDVLASGSNDPAPVAYWRLGEPASASIAVDAAPTPQNGTYVNAPTRGVAGAIMDDWDTAVDFDGVNDFVEVLDAAKLRLSGSFAIEMWVKPHGTFVGHKYFINKGNWLALIFGYGPNYPDSINFLAAAHGGFCEPGFPTGLAEIQLHGEEENWHHIVYTYNHLTNVWQGYKDGSLAFSTTCGFSLDSSHSDPLRIATSDPGAGENNHINATIDEVALYDDYLPSAQVVAHYNNALAANSPLRFEQRLSVLNGVPGLNGAQGVATSGDGAHVYATSDIDDSIVVFTRSAITGALTYAFQKKDGVGGIDGLNGAFGLVVSADGKSVYATGEAEDKLARFDRNPVTGDLSQGVGYVIQDGVGSGSGGPIDGLNAPKEVAVSADGKSVYVTALNDDSVAVFARDPNTGAITDFVQVIKDISSPSLALNGAWGVAVSPDSAHVYVTSDLEDAVNVFSRNTTTGALTLLETKRDGVSGVDGIQNARSVAISSDGKHAYVAGRSDDAVAIFSRATSGGNFGRLTYVGLVKDGVGSVDGLNGATSVACDPPGSRCYVAGELDDAVAAFSRNPTTGMLTFLEQEKDAITDTSDCASATDGLNAVRAVAVSPDSANVYSAGFTDDAVSSFSVW